MDLRQLLVHLLLGHSRRAKVLSARPGCSLGLAPLPCPSSFLGKRFAGLPRSGPSGAVLDLPGLPQCLTNQGGEPVRRQCPGLQLLLDPGQIRRLLPGAQLLHIGDGLPLPVPQTDLPEDVRQVLFLPLPLLLEGTLHRRLGLLLPAALGVSGPLLWAHGGSPAGRGALLLSPLSAGSLTALLLPLGSLGSRRRSDPGALAPLSRWLSLFAGRRTALGLRISCAALARLSAVAFRCYAQIAEDLVRFHMYLSRPMGGPGCFPCPWVVVGSKSALHPQGARHIRKAAEPPTAVQPAPAVRQVSPRSLAPPPSSANASLVCLGAPPSGAVFSFPHPTGGESKEGAAATSLVVARWGSRGRDTIESVPSPCALLVTFPAREK